VALLSGLKNMPNNQSESPNRPPAATPEKPGMSALSSASVLLLGVYLGILFTKSEVASWQRVHDMFLFREARMYLIIGVAIAVAMVSMLLITRLQLRDIAGKPIVYEPKPYHRGVVIGGMLFGAGWAITGACPGPIYAQIGGGEWLACFTLAGAMLGMFCYAALKPRLPH
jgi:uncharacterized membrane protein YedE/YeeE